MRFNIQYSILAGLLILLSGCQRIKEVEPTYNESGTALASEPSYVVASMAPIVVTISSQPRPSWPVIPSPLSSPLPTQVATQVPTQSATPTKVPTTLTSTVPSEKPTLGVEPTLTRLPTPSEMPTVTVMLTPIGKPSPTPLPTLIPVETPILKPTTPPLVTPIATPIAKPTQPPLVTPTNVPPQDPPVVATVLPSNVPTVLPTVLPTNVPSPGYVNLLWTRPLQREDGTTLPASEISVYRLRYFDENGMVAVTDVPGTQTNVQIWAEKPYRYEIATVDTDGLQSDFVGPTTSPTTQATRTP